MEAEIPTSVAESAAPVLELPATTIVDPAAAITPDASNIQVDTTTVPSGKTPVWPSPIVEDFNDPEWPNLEDSDENILGWVMKNKRLLVRTVTWNLCARPPPAKEEVQKNLFCKKFHLYVIGSEECERSIAQSALNPSKKNWEGYLREALGAGYVPLRSHTLQAIHIMAFVHKSLSHLCSVVTSAALPTGVGNTLGNKGAVALYLQIGSTKMLVVNAHLSAHQKAEKQRNAEFQKMNIMLPQLLEKKDSAVQFSSGEEVTTNFDNTFSPGSEAAGASSPVPPTVDEKANTEADENAKKKEDEEDSDDAGEDVLTPPSNTIEIKSATQSSTSILKDGKNGKQLHQCADVVVFMGDLNYRIKGNRSIISKLLASNMHDVLLSNDQLKLNKSQGLVFEKFTEAPLNFRPTYKFDIGTNTYDSGPKNRIPSWTDRILFVDSPNITCLSYNSDESLMTSDHRPVYASFMVSFNAFVTLDDNQNAVVPQSTVKFTSESQVCVVS